MYKHLIRPILFKFNPETAHQMTMKGLRILSHIPLGRNIVRMIFKREHPDLSREVFGIKPCGSGRWFGQERRML